MRCSLSAEVEEAPEEWAERCDAADDDTDAVFGVAPEDNVGDAVKVFVGVG